MGQSPLPLQYSNTPTLQPPGFPNELGRLSIALVLMALLGGSLIFLLPGYPEQDSGYHFVMARAAWHEPVYFVDVWARPLYTLAFSGPALLGFKAARFFALAISLLVAWQTWRLAQDLRLERTWLVVPLLLAQPTFFELFTDLLTEPLFALTFVVALRLHLRGRIKMGMLLASLLPLARPEGVVSLPALGMLGFERLLANRSTRFLVCGRRFSSFTWRWHDSVVDSCIRHFERSILHRAQLANPLAEWNLWARFNLELLAACLGIYRSSACRFLAHRPSAFALAQKTRIDHDRMALIFSPAQRFPRLRALW